MWTVSFQSTAWLKGWEQAKYVGLVGMFGEKLSINEKLFDGLYLWLFVTVLIMTLLLLSAAYDIKQQFQLAHSVFKSGIWESPAETEHFCSICISWDGSAGWRVHSRATSWPDWQVRAGSSLGPQRRLPALAPWHVGLSTELLRLPDSMVAGFQDWVFPEAKEKANGLLLTETWKSRGTISTAFNWSNHCQSLSPTQIQEEGNGTPVLNDTGAKNMWPSLNTHRPSQKITILKGYKIVLTVLLNLTSYFLLLPKYNLLSTGHSTTGNINIT